MAQVEQNDVQLNISPEKACYIIVKAREFDAKVAPVEDEPGSNPADSGEREILEDYKDDPTAQELTEAINSLNDDEVIDVITLAWIGRGDFTKVEWSEARALAEERHRPNSANYLLGMPGLGDYLEEGLAQLDYSCSDYELNRL